MKDILYFDIHAHLQFEDFDMDRDEVLDRAREARVGIINISTDLETSKQSIELAEKNDGVYGAVGIHPCYINKQGSTLISDIKVKPCYEEMKKLATHPKVVVIGECGIDLFHNKPETLAKQIEIFEMQLQLASEVKKPVMLHLRNSKDGESAYKIAIEILKKYPEVRANAHFFAGTVEEARQFVDLGHTISFTGAITFPKALQYTEVIRSIPLESIMCETDCPYVAPVPHRGERNEPVFVTEIVKKIAEIKNEPLEKAASQIRENVKRVFAI